MGLFDRFKKKDVFDINDIDKLDSTVTTPSPIQSSSYTKVVENEPAVKEANARLDTARREYAKETIITDQQISGLKSRIDDYHKSQQNSYANDVVAKQAKEILDQIKQTDKKSEFDLRYGAIFSFVGTVYFLSEGRAVGKTAKEYLLSGSLQKTDIDAIIYPYLIEKKLCDLIEPGENKRLASFGSEKEKIRKLYTDGLLLQQKLNLTDLSDEENYSESFALSTLSREELITKAKEGSKKL